MVIRREQMELLSVTGLENHLRGHLTRFAPNHIGSVGEVGLRKLVRLGIQRAAGFGWSQWGPAEFFLELMITLGSEFHTDPQYPWAAVALDRSMEEMAAADHLHAESMKFHDAVYGPGLCYETEAIQRLLASASGSGPSLGKTTEAEIHRSLEWAFPRRCSFAGEAAVSAVIQEAKRQSQQAGIPATGLALLANMSLVLGHGWLTDPQYPWILSSLQVPGGVKEEGLHRAFRSWLQVSVTNLEKE
jgi:hypothetical protein